MNRVLELNKRGVFNDQDVALARMAERYSDHLSDLPLVTAWVSQWTQSGHICLSVETFFSELTEDVDLSGVQIPSLKEWVHSVPSDHPFVGDGSRGTPVVVDKGRGLLYLHRWFAAENRVAAAIKTRLAMEPTVLSNEEHRRLNKLFPEPDSIGQRNAVETALSAPFSIITGGPGTGKTTTILKLIDLFVAHHGEGVRVSLCAPTGKAVSRMDESIRGQINASSDEQLKRVFSFEPAAPVDPPTTLHRLLGSNPVRGTCRYNYSNKLPYDLIVVDESSMMDLLLMNGLIHALRSEAHLILVGDKDQLPAVGSGTVFSDLCNLSRLDPVIGRLSKNWRASDAPGIVALASMVNEGVAEGTIQILKAGNDNLEWFHQDVNFADVIKDKALSCWCDLRACSSAEQAFAVLERFQVLCAVRKGPTGVHAVNNLARELLKESSSYYHGLPIIISSNDRQVKLFNGDVGVILRDGNNELRAFFPAESGYRAVSISRLPEHQSVYAMTIHKSQGSEAENILVVLPETESPILTKELLYTAITRAKKKVILWASGDIIRRAVKRHVSRVSGLQHRID